MPALRRQRQAGHVARASAGRLKAHLTSSTVGRDCAAADACSAIDITKVADGTLVSAGDQIGYEITVTDDAPSAARAVTMTDTLPTNPGTAWTVGASSAGWLCSIRTGKLTCGGSLTSLASGRSLKVHITSTTTSGTCGTVTNLATVSTSNVGTATATARVTVECAQIRLTKVADHSEVSAGDLIGYEITATNSGPGTAYGVTMTDVLPVAPGVTWTVGTTSPGWTCLASTGTLTCGGVGTSLSPGRSLRVHITSPTTSASCGTITNTASVTTTNDGTDTGSARITVLCAKIGLTKTPDDAVVSAGDPIGYTITVTNHGAGTAHGVTMTDTLPTTPGTSWSFGLVSPDWTCAITTAVLTCGGPSTTLSFGRSLRVHVSSPTTSASCGTVHNTAHVITTNDGSASATARVTVECARIDLTKVADNPQVSAGDEIGYVITATNNGAGTARGVTMTDTLPVTPGTHWTVDSASPGWTCAIAAGLLTCGGPTTSLSSGDSLRVHVISPTTSASCGTVDNTATVVTTNDGAATASASIEVQCAKIEITKTADQSVVPISGALGYTITVTNRGPGTAGGVTMTDPLPAVGTSWTVDAHSPGWSCAIAARTLTCGGSTTTLAAGASLSVHVTTPATTAACGPVVNTASVTTSNDGTASASATVDVVCPQHPLISTKVSHTVIGQGGTLTDTSTLTGNAGTVTGTVDFQLCSDTTTGCPHGSGTNIDANVPLVNGVATSRPFGHALPPGNYCVGLVYLNDGHSPYADYYSGSPTGECFTVRKHKPAFITTRLSRHLISAGDFVRDFAALHGATRGVRGTVRYRFYSTLRGCRADVLAWPSRPRHGRGAGIVPVHGALVPGSRLVRFHRVGTYYWAAFYSGDARNAPAASRCLSEILIVRRHAPAVTTRLSSHRIGTGGLVNDRATLHGVTRGAGGIVQYRVYSTLKGCRADVLAWPRRPRHGSGAGIVRVRGGKVPASRWVRFRRAGTYYWAAFYSGGTKNVPAASRCLTEVLRVGRSRVSVTTWLSRHVIWRGQSVLDWATLRGVTGGVRGTVQFRYYATLAACRADTAAWPVSPQRGVFVQRFVVRGTRTPDTRLVRFGRAGTYYWAAFYSGDARNGPAASSCVSEILRVR